jgi:acyl carrier protein
MSSDEIFGRLSAVLEETLNVDAEEIKPAARLLADLGAESIDFLDIVFRLEREFGLQIPRGELFPESIFSGDPEFVRDGKVTDKGLAELRAKLPFADLRVIERDRSAAALSDLFTVGALARYLEHKLQESAASAAVVRD